MHHRAVIALGIVGIAGWSAGLLAVPDEHIAQAAFFLAFVLVSYMKEMLIEFVFTVSVMLAAVASWFWQCRSCFWVSTHSGCGIAEMDGDFDSSCTIEAIVSAADKIIGGLTDKEKKTLHKSLENLIEGLKTPTSIAFAWFAVVFLLVVDPNGKRRPEDDEHITKFIGEIALWATRYFHDDGSNISKRNMGYLSIYLR